MNLPRKVSYYLDPGYVYFSKRAATVRTVVGSCVAVCIWDRELKYGGMNHFLWPVMQDPDKATPKYGNVATTALIQLMERAGSKRDSLMAQILGGAAPEDVRGEHVGIRNVNAATEVLTRKGVRIASKDTGGTVGRKIVFDTGTGELAVLKVQKLRAGDWHA